MKIIKEGKEIKGTMIVVCKTCEAELEIEASDLTKHTEGYEPSNYSYECPCCRRDNYLKTEDLTEEIIFDFFLNKRRL